MVYDGWVYGYDAEQVSAYAYGTMEHPSPGGPWGPPERPSQRPSRPSQRPSRPTTIPDTWRPPQREVPQWVAFEDMNSTKRKVSHQLALSVQAIPKYR